MSESFSCCCKSIDVSCESQNLDHNLNWLLLLLSVLEGRSGSFALLPAITSIKPGIIVCQINGPHVMATTDLPITITFDQGLDIVAYGQTDFRLKSLQCGKQPLLHIHVNSQLP